MTKKDLVFCAVILVLVTLFLWQWVSKGALITRLSQLQKYNNQMQLLTGIGALNSAHLHADVKVYIDGKAIDFSQRRYQLQNSFIHFEEGIGDVVHTHATGLTMGHLFKSLGINFDNNCITVDGQGYCNDNDKKLKFYIRGQSNNNFDNYIIKDLDKILISYGNEDEAAIQQQLSSVTNLAAG